MTIRELIESCPHEVCHWQPGQTITVQGAESESIYLVLAGDLESWHQAGDRSELSAHLTVGDTFGEAGLFSPGAATTTVRATGKAWGLRVRHAYLALLGERSPNLARELRGEILDALRTSPAHASALDRARELANSAQTGMISCSP